MDNYEFEKSFSDFLEQNEYEEAESAIFSLVRAAFWAGWKAAILQNSSNSDTIE